MDRDRGLLAALVVAYAVGAGVAVSRAPVDPGTPATVDPSFLLSGSVVAVSTGLLVAGVVAAAWAVRGIVGATTTTKLSLALGGAFLGYLGLSIWIAAPFDVRGDQWIASPVSPGETLLLRGVALSLFVLGGASLGRLYVKHRTPDRRNGQPPGSAG